MPLADNLENRTLTIAAPWSGANALIGFQGEDKISFPFSYHLEVLSDELELDPLTIVGKECKFSMKTSPDDELLELTGKVWRFSAEGTYEYEDERLRFYTVELTPHFKFLSLNKNSRVFQELTIPEILGQVLKDQGVANKSSLKGTYAKLDYCVQYQESDYEFAQRIMEEAGIFYFFEDSGTMVLADAATGYGALSVAGVGLAGENADGGIESWSHFYRMAPAEVVISEYEFQTPGVVTGKEKTVVKLKADKFEVFDHPGAHPLQGAGIKAADAKSIAVARMEGYEKSHNVVAGVGRWEQFRAGYKFELESHSSKSELGKFALTWVKHQVRDPFLNEKGSERDRYINQFECVPDKVVFRTNPSPHRPIIVGPQPALVVGPKNSDVHVDKFGRVKISFPWDRESKNDDTSSCWVRVSQSWAGKEWGSLFLPRVGQEVLVEFMNGDPNRPIVTGRVYNAEQMPPVKLPDDRLTSTIKTYSDKDRYNELRFVDVKDKEQIFFHASKDLVRVVEEGGGEALSIGVKGATPTAEKDSQTVMIKENRTVTLDKGSDTLTLKTGDQNITLSKGSQTITIKQGDHALDVKAGAISITAAKKITLKVGGSSIVLDTQGIVIKGTKLSAVGVAKADIKSPMTTVSGDGMLTLKGGMVKIN